jgi:hypothetical protein
MLPEELLKAQHDIEKILQPLMNKPFDEKCKHEAQYLVDCYFRKRMSKENPIIVESAGIQLSGCELAFTENSIALGKWITSFYPWDVYSVMSTESGPIPLGYWDGAQLYILSIKGKPGTIMARFSMTKFIPWTPSVQGMPAENSIHFVALERAKVLGFLHKLQTVQ